MLSKLKIAVITYLAFVKSGYKNFSSLIALSVDDSIGGINKTGKTLSLQRLRNIFKGLCCCLLMILLIPTFI